MNIFPQLTCSIQLNHQVVHFHSTASSGVVIINYFAHSSNPYSCAFLIASCFKAIVGLVSKVNLCRFRKNSKLFHPPVGRIATISEFICRILSITTFCAWDMKFAFKSPSNDLRHSIEPLDWLMVTNCWGRAKSAQEGKEHSQLVAAWGDKRTLLKRILVGVVTINASSSTCFLLVCELFPFRNWCHLFKHVQSVPKHFL